MRKIEMTAAAVERFKASAGTREDILDQGQPGLVLRVSGPSSKRPQGGKSWTVFYRVRGSQKLRRFTIGDFPTFSLKDARAAARRVRQDGAAGTDSMVEKRAAARREPDTIEAIVDKFMKRYMEQKNLAPSYIAGTRALFDNHVLPRWKGRELKTITRPDVVDLLDEIVDAGKPVAANRTLAALRKLCNWSLQRGIIHVAPTSAIEMPGAETRRERALSDVEIAILWPQLDAFGYPFGPYLQTALATGQRRSEVATMRWMDLDLEGDKVWEIPAEQTKADRPHIVPLSPLVRDLLKTLPRIGSYVFATREDRAIVGFSKLKARLDRALKNAADANPDAPKVAAWTIHDARRTLATGLGRLKTQRFIISRVLNHGDRSVTGIYDRYEYLEEKRVALDAWARTLKTIFDPTPENVVELRPEREAIRA